MEESLQTKQTFLRENVLEKGLNADQFMNFLQSKKGETGLDLNNWGMDELVNTVNEFKEIPPNSEQINDNNNLDSNNNIENNNQNNNYNDEDSDEKYEQLLIKELEKKRENQDQDCCTCLITELTEISNNKDITIKISLPEKVDKGTFSKSYTTYLVETLPLNFQVRKRYSDFEYLYNSLISLYPNCLVPPISKKNYTDRFSENLIIKRTRTLKQFLDNIIIHPLMRNSDLVYKFLTMKEEEFEDLKKKLKITTPTIAKNLKSEEGTINISISKERENYLDNIKDNSNINEGIMKQISQAYGKLLTLMNEVSDKMKEISDLWKKLHEKSVKYFETVNTCETYSIMHKIMNEFSNFEKSKNELFKIHIREYFRFIKNEFHNLSELANKVYVHKDNYNKECEKLFNQKENLFKQQDISNWGLGAEELKHKNVLIKNKDFAFQKMLPEETNKLEELKKYYGAFLNSIINEYERIRLLNGKRHKEKINFFIKSLTDTITEFHIFLADQTAYFDEVKDDEVNYPMNKNSNRNLGQYVIDNDDINDINDANNNNDNNNDNNDDNYNNQETPAEY